MDRPPGYNPDMPNPDYIPIGNSVRLCSLRALAGELGLTIPSTRAMLRSLRVPLFQLPSTDTWYFNLPTLEGVLYCLLRPGGRGWYTNTIGEEIAQQLASLSIQREMASVAKVWGSSSRKRMRERCAQFGRALKKAQQALVNSSTTD